MPRGSGTTLSGKWLAGGASALMILAVLRPIAQNWREEPTDSFPFSYYPMFTRKRRQAVNVTYFVGLGPRGERYRIPHGYVGVGGLKQVRRQISRALKEDKVEQLCQAVAARVALEEERPFCDVLEVHIVTGKYRLADYFEGRKEPVSERVRASCRVMRRPTP